jgi:hypothetical protein
MIGRHLHNRSLHLLSVATKHVSPFNVEGVVSRSAKRIEVTSRAGALTYDLSNAANRKEKPW